MLALPNASVNYPHCILQAAFSFPVAASTGGAAAYEDLSDWRVIRSDYVEFCDANIATINIPDSSLRDRLATAIRTEMVGQGLVS
jgi:hypothetical protein